MATMSRVVRTVFDRSISGALNVNCSLAPAGRMACLSAAHRISTSRTISAGAVSDGHAALAMPTPSAPIAQPAAAEKIPYMRTRKMSPKGYKCREIDPSSLRDLTPESLAREGKQVKLYLEMLGCNLRRIERAKVLMNSSSKPAEVARCIRLDHLMELHQFLSSRPLYLSSGIVRKVIETIPEFIPTIQIGEAQRCLDIMTKTLFLTENEIADSIVHSPLLLCNADKMEFKVNFLLERGVKPEAIRESFLSNPKLLSTVVAGSTFRQRWEVLEAAVPRHLLRLINEDVSLMSKSRWSLLSRLMLCQHFALDYEKTKFMLLESKSQLERVIGLTEETLKGLEAVVRVACKDNLKPYKVIRQKLIPQQAKEIETACTSLVKEDLAKKAKPSQALPNSTDGIPFLSTMDDVLVYLQRRNPIDRR